MRASRRLWLLLALLAFVPAMVSAQEPAVHYLDFAHYLMEDGDWYRAVTEAKRFVFLSPDHERRGEAELMMGRAYLGAGRPVDAEGHYQKAAASRDGAVRRAALLELGVCLERLAAPDRVEAYYLRLASRESPEPALRDEALYRLGWMRLEAGRWEEGSDFFRQVDPKGPLGPASAMLAQKAPAGRDLDYRSPDTAGMLSGAAPGAGQLYTGRTTDASIAFASNAALAYAAYEAYRNKSWGVFAVLVLAEAVVYGGNVYNAVNGAHIHNRQEQGRFLNQLRAEAERLQHPGRLDPAAGER